MKKQTSTKKNYQKEKIHLSFSVNKNKNKNSTKKIQLRKKIASTPLQAKGSNKYKRIKFFNLIIQNQTFLFQNINSKSIFSKIK